MSTPQSQPPASPPPGLRVNGYELLHRIGEGGMGVVHLARRPGEVRVALKVLRPQVIGDDEARARLAQEVSSLSRIRSPRIAEIIDSDPYGDIPYVATRYVPGWSLHQVVKREGALPAEDLFHFAGELVEAMSVVHAVGVVHRDIKPSNVLLEGRNPVLIDFGLARVADDPRLTHSGWMLGTPGYLAPEILHGEEASTASDVHSWAATVAFAATGHPPFGGGPALAVMDRVRRGEYRIDGIDEPLAGLLRRALAPEAADRPTVRELRSWFSGDASMTAVHQVGGPAVVPLAPPEISQPQVTLPMTMAPADAPLPAARAVDRHGDAVTDRLPTAAESAPVRAPGHPGVLPAAVPAAGPAAVPDARSDEWADEWSGDWEGAPREPHRPEGPLDAAHTTPFAPSGPTQVVPDWNAAHASALAQERADQWAPGGSELDGFEPAPTLGARIRHGLLVAGSIAVAGAATALAPVITLVVLALLVWLVRATSMVGGARQARRSVRGTSWYDPIHTVLATPWHLVRALPGAALLVLWGIGMALAVLLLTYAFSLEPVPSLAAAGAVLAGALWLGPGAGRWSGPVARAYAPAVARPAVWCAVLFALVVLTCGLLAVADAGVRWFPLSKAPVSSLR